jgi:hypothetical protein
VNGHACPHSFIGTDSHRYLNRGITLSETFKASTFLWTHSLSFISDSDWLGLHAADKEVELFDIVDDHNKVIGQQQRSVVHTLGLKHRAVYCFVFNSNGDLLLQQRSPKYASQTPKPCKAAALKSHDIWQRLQPFYNHIIVQLPKYVSRKKIGPLQWDLSIAEHLEPGEEYRQVQQTLIVHPKPGSAQ